MKLKQILQKWVVHNIGYKLAAIVFAFILWLVIVNIQDYTITRTIYNIPVTIKNEHMIPESEYVYAISSGNMATVVVMGNRSIVGNLKASDFEAVANFAELSLVNAVPINISLTGEMAAYSDNVTIIQKTKTMTLTLEDVVRKMIDVELKYVGDKPENMVIDEAVIEPAKIEIVAPKSIVEGIAKIEATVNMNDVKDEVTLRATPTLYDFTEGVITDLEQIEMSAQEVNITFGISATKSVEVFISTMGTPAAGHELKGITYSFNEVVIKGDEEVLKKIIRLRLPETLLNIEEATDDRIIAVDLTQYLPEGTEIFDNNVNIVITAIIDKSDSFESLNNFPPAGEINN
ncbi:MAG: YbbR-like domain-containing protein [Lachnospiraceae bacterium]|jgi:YbbR domain-containing protein